MTDIFSAKYTKKTHYSLKTVIIVLSSNPISRYGTLNQYACYFIFDRFADDDRLHEPLPGHRQFDSGIAR